MALKAYNQLYIQCIFSFECFESGTLAKSTAEWFLKSGNSGGDSTWVLYNRVLMVRVRSTPQHWEDSRYRRER